MICHSSRGNGTRSLFSVQIGISGVFLSDLLTSTSRSTELKWEHSLCLSTVKARSFYFWNQSPENSSRCAWKCIIGVIGLKHFPPKGLNPHRTWKWAIISVLQWCSKYWSILLGLVSGAMNWVLHSRWNAWGSCRALCCLFTLIPRAEWTAA